MLSVEVSPGESAFGSTNLLYATPLLGNGNSCSARMLLSVFLLPLHTGCQLKDAGQENQTLNPLMAKEPITEK